MEAVEAGTITVGSGSTTNVGLSLGGGDSRALKFLIRTSDQDVFLGNSGVSSASTGYELVPDKEYEILVRATVGNSSGAANGVNVYNGGASSASLSYLITAAE